MVTPKPTFSPLGPLASAPLRVWARAPGDALLVVGAALVWPGLVRAQELGSLATRDQGAEAWQADAIWLSGLIGAIIGLRANGALKGLQDEMGPQTANLARWIVATLAPFLSVLAGLGAMVLTAGQVGQDALLAAGLVVLQLAAWGRAALAIGRNRAGGAAVIVAGSWLAPSMLALLSAPRFVIAWFDARWLADLSPLAAIWSAVITALAAGLAASYAEGRR